MPCLRSRTSPVMKAMIRPPPDPRDEGEQGAASPTCRTNGGALHLDGEPYPDSHFDTVIG